MEKEFEALKNLFDSNYENSHEDYDLVYDALSELKAIKESNPSEALDRLLQDVFNSCDSDEVLTDYNIIKQTLLKTQDLEKENKKMKDLLLELSDIDPDNVDCVSQCISVVKTILECNISKDINRSCELNLNILKKL